MKIIQSFNTFGGAKLSGGFTTTRALRSYLQKSVKHHKSLCDYVMYTDKEGYEIIKDIIPDAIIFDFKIELDDKLIYIGKFQVQAIQTEAYLHVDLDATILELPAESDCYCSKYRPCYELYKEANYLKIKHNKIYNIPCSSVIGFSDILFKNLYIKEVFDRFVLLDKLPEITFKMAYHLEEVLLERLIIDNKKTMYEVSHTHIA